MSTMRSQDEIRNTVVSLGLPEHPYFMRRAARAMDLLDTGKVNFVGDEIFRVHSQFDDTIYHVELNHGLPPRCDCADYQKNPGVSCKHIISSLLYTQRQAKSLTIYDDTANSYLGRGRWIVTDHVAKIRYQIYRDSKGGLHCPCERGRKGKDCEHKKAIREYTTNNGDGGGNGSKLAYEFGSNNAKELQDKMNGQIDSRNDNGNGANKAPSQHLQLDVSNPFEESESYDIEQIEGRRNGELAWKLSNGGYVISYQGIMSLSQKHHIAFETAIHSETHTVIAKGRCGTSERVSGKPINGNLVTAMELAKRNCARQLLPLAEIKATECKAKLEAEFDWQKAQAKCVELVGIEANVDIIIHELVKDGKLRQDSPTHYDRTEWLIIHNACQKDADDNNDGGDETPSSNEVNRYKVLADAEVNPNFQQRYDECKKLVGMSETDLIIRQELNFRYSYYKNKITNDQWDVVLQECRYRWNAKQAKAEFASAQQAYKFKHIRDISGYDVKSKQFVGRPPLNSKEFLAKCQEAIEKVRAEDVGLSPTITTKNTVEANEQPLEGGNGKRQLQMDKKLRTWLIEADGSKKKISCREICEQFNDGSLVTRLRACIDDGADISTVELND